MTNSIPSREILNAFGVKGKPILLKGGQGKCYRVGKVVFKPTDNQDESNWVCDILDAFEDENVCVPKPICAINGKWVFNGWTAHHYIEGEHKYGICPEKIKVYENFHKAISGIQRPSFLDHNNDPWAVADRMAWNEQPLPDNKIIKNILNRLQKATKEINLPNQLIHGDIGENILFHEKYKPIVIDLCPYWRPAYFATAVAVIDAIVWQNAQVSVLDLFKDVDDFKQLLIRALVRRICELDEIFRQYGKDHTSDIMKYISAADIILEKIQKQ